MKKHLTALVFILILIPASSSASILFKPKPIDLGFDNIQQEARNWCWAAIVQQILTWRGNPNPPSQCQLVTEANRDRGETRFNCCDQPTALPAECNRSGNQLEMMTLINRYGGRVDGVQMPDTPEQVHEYLAAGRALVVGIDVNAEYNHAIIIRGITWESGQAMLRVNDPARKEATLVPFDSSRPGWLMTQVITK